MPALYRIRLTGAERTALTTLTRQGTRHARVITRAHALLLADGGRRDAEIAQILGISARTVQRVRRRAVERGALAAIQDRPRPGGRPKLDGHQQAYLVALACSDPPAGRAHWTMQLLATRMVDLNVVASLSDETVRRTLKKTTSSPGNGSSGASLR